MSDTRGSGNWNRAGRRSGGDMPMRIEGAKPGVSGPVLGPCCVLGRHEICEGCDCKCHAAPPLSVNEPR